ncbi:MAG TPA: FAD/NAD(P)-binding oxidoreductase [Thiobacillaceae bacterium]|nr:FAD/NAD(P)-binding oxidoreductase [Thiobacillaceae bacterium]HNA80863.1 FAD/NAD(P)-binding oxidoreductase [Thiobacillaceae bacterium]HNF88270.1 FAD/NAD(P)-binding oxidoreductase [Thiobacillaceae bacterium]HNH88286.1 FAD/NAD(P)-binding oxidoreductase [Thiobacillaceae bacterium]HNI07706.1 FAD/NAD(P)-binding oxidoreductase [Thiobacillaceae bacterium]
MSENSSRRNFLKMSGAVAAAGATGALGMAAPVQAKAMPTGKMMAALPKAKGPRLVVVGGGTSGLTIAKYAKKEYPKFDVVLVEKRDMYSSCFSSNMWYAGVINLEFLADHSFMDAAVNNGYVYFNATVTGLDRHSRTLETNEGDIHYDFLVLAPGISYDYEKIGVKDVEVMTALRQTYPGGFISPTEHVTLHRKIREFEGGVFLQTVPSGNYRCLPGPYERACLLASTFKKNKVKGKVLVLDANPEITIKKEGFHAAFNDLYKGYLEWLPSKAVMGVDVEKKVVKTEFDEFKFDDAAIYANVRGSTLIEQLGLMAPASKSNQKEANIDTRYYNIVGDPHVYVTGDSRPHPYSKSANTSNTEGHYMAKVLAARAQGKEIPWVSPRTICYSMVNANPLEAISVDAGYDYSAEKDAITGFSKDTKTFENRDGAKGQATLEWARGMYRDMFDA